MDGAALTEQAPPVRPWHHFIAVFLAVIGGLLGIVGAFVQEVRTGGFILLPIVGAPMIEEALKPAGIYILLARWPQLLRSQIYAALLTAISGLSFGVLEALAYVWVYADNPPDWFVTYRFTAPLALHTTASFIMGLGINRSAFEWAARGAPLPKRSRNCYIAAVLLHAAFNTTGIILWVAGVFPGVN